MTTNTLRSTRRLTMALATAAGIALAGCGGDDGGSQEASEVLIELVAFQPEQLEVPAGATVTWRNADPGAHTVTSGSVEQGGAGVTLQPDGAFDSGELAKGETFERAFAEPGTYPYFCSIHPATMRGEIRVT
ncbi:MAG: plastocyanin/azurin family copper-binding protein [Actinomycetota bacterium]